MNRTSDPNLRKAQILDAALERFTRQGIRQTNMEDVAEEAGISKGLTYWYYKSKDALLHAILKRMLDDDLRQLEAGLATPGAARERIMRAVEETSSQATGNPLILSLFYEFYGMMTRNKTVRRTVHECFKREVGLFSRAIQEGVDAGEFRAVDPVLTAETILSIQEGLYIQWMVNPSGRDWGRHASDAMRLFLDGFTNKP